MANNGQYNGSAASIIREEDLQDLEALKTEIQGRIDRMRDEGRGYMMGQYVRIQAMLRAETKRIRARFERESQAADNKAQRELAKLEREQAKAAQEA